VADQDGALDRSVAHHGLDGAGEELDGIRAVGFVARAMARQVDQERTAIGVVIKRLLAAPEGEIASPAMDEYQRFAARAVALVVDPQAVESRETGGVASGPGLAGSPECAGDCARGSQCQESPPEDRRLQLRN